MLFFVYILFSAGRFVLVHTYSSSVLRSVEMSSQKRKVLSIEEKGLIICRLEQGESNIAIARELGLSHSSVSTIWKNRDAIKNAFNENLLPKKKLRLSSHVDIDEALFNWFKVERSRGSPISGPILQAKAEHFGRLLNKGPEYTCAESWIKRFRKRHNIVYGKISGEAASVPPGVTENWLKTVWPEIRKGYTSDEIFNADETGLFYKMLPDMTLKFKGEKCTGGKMSKERMTLFVAANMSGSEKRKLIVIGKSKNPRCFKNVKTLPVTYMSNKKAWMTSDLFIKILRDWDSELMKKKKKILLLVDNCPAHPKVSNLKNINLQFLPPNTTSVLQPVDQGIIRSLKVHYRKYQLMNIIENNQLSKESSINILDAISMISKAWNRVLQQTIINCFKHAGFLEQTLETADPEDDIPLAELARRMANDFDTEDYVPLSVIKENFKLTDELWTDFIDSDTHLETNSTLGDEQIAEEVLTIEETQDEGEEDRSEDGEEFRPPSVIEALQAVKTLNSFVLYNHSSDEKLLDATSFIEKKIESIYFNSRCKKQAKITDFLLK